MNDDDFRVQALQKYIEKQCRAVCVNGRWEVVRPIDERTNLRVTRNWPTEEAAIETAIQIFAINARREHRAELVWKHKEGP